MRRVLIAALVATGVWPVLALYRPRPNVVTSADYLRRDHAELQCFATGVYQHTEPRASIVFLVPEDDSDGGLIGHRLRYVVPGRQILTAGKTRYVASWRQPAAPAGQIVWSGCGGVLVRR